MIGELLNPISLSNLFFSSFVVTEWVFKKAFILHRIRSIVRHMVTKLNPGAQETFLHS